jgi:2-amino-4-hydroxy-6-hydroxymethyldihydropteridine diphosphokinase
MPLKQVYLSLGSNLGNREENLRLALEHLNSAGVPVLARSSLYETAPQDVIDQPWFLNMAVGCETSLLPLRLLTLLQRIERKLGRVRGHGELKRGPRTIDIDILLYGTATVHSPQLVIPHPRIIQRRFVLEPLLEIAPQLRHPQTGALLQSFLSDVADQHLKKFNPH